MTMFRAVLLVLAAVGAVSLAVQFLQSRADGGQKREAPYTPPAVESPQRRDLR
jgi:hypothetical protein